MKPKRLVVVTGIMFLLLTLVALPLLAACATPSAPTPAPTPAPAGGPPQKEAEFHWRMQSAFPAADITTQVHSSQIAKIIEEASEGRIKVDHFPGESIVGFNELVSAVQEGTLEVGYHFSPAASDLIPENNTSALPGLCRNVGEQYYYLYKTGRLEIMREAFKENGFFLLCNALPGEEVIYTSFDVTGWNDFKGRKGSSTPQTINILTELGAVVVPVAGWDEYTGMKLGNIDFFLYTIGELETLKFYEVAKSVILEPPSTMPTDDCFVNLKAWEAIGPELQNKIDMAVRAKLIDMALEYRKRNAHALETGEKNGVKLVKFSAADIKKYEDLSIKDWDRIAAMNSRAAQLIGIAKDFMSIRDRLR